SGASSSLAGFGNAATGGSTRAITTGTTGGNTTGGSIAGGRSMRSCTIGVKNFAGRRGSGFTSVRGPCATGTSNGVVTRPSGLGWLGDRFTTGNDSVTFGG